MDEELRQEPLVEVTEEEYYLVLDEGELLDVRRVLQSVFSTVAAV